MDGGGIGVLRIAWSKPYTRDLSVDCLPNSVRRFMLQCGGMRRLAGVGVGM